MTEPKATTAEPAEILDEAAREARREYMKEWQRNNPEKVAEYHRRYWQKKGAELLARRKANNDH